MPAFSQKKSQGMPKKKRKKGEREEGEEGREKERRNKTEQSSQWVQTQILIQMLELTDRNF